MKQLPRLIVFSDLTHYPGSTERLLALCEEVQPGQLAIVLRDRSMQLHDRLALGHALRVATKSAGQLLFVVDRWDLYVALDADGLHLGTDAVLPSRVRSKVKWLSRGIHGIELLGAHEVQLLDVVLVSPAFAPLKGKSALGLDGLRAQLNWLALTTDGAPPRAYALGSVHADNASSALALGYHGVACISAILDRATAAQLYDRLSIRRA